MNFFSKNIMGLFCLFLTACNSVSYISINVKKPANIIFPAGTAHVIVVNDANLLDGTGNHLFEYENRKTDVIRLETDTLATVLCHFLWMNLAGQSFFDRVDYFNIPVDKKDAVIESVWRQADADAVIELKAMDVKSRLSLKNTDDYGILRSVYEVMTYAQFDLFELNSEWEKSITIADTIFWEAFGLDANEALLGLPCLDDALLESAHQMAVVAMEKIIPHWAVEYRRYYISAKGRMKDAAKSVRSNDWESAFQHWTAAYETATHPVKKAKIAANIALYHEMQNELESAVNWAGKSLDGFKDSPSKKDRESLSYMQDYTLRLQLRQKENALLDVQERVNTK